MDEETVGRAAPTARGAMNRRALELGAAGLFAVFFAVLFFQAVGYPGRSAYMPAAASGIGLLMCCVWALRAVRLLASGQAERYDATRSDVARFALILVAAAMYVAGFIWVGFFTSTIVMVPAVAMTLGYRNRTAVASTTLGFALVLYAVFRILLSVPLPPEALLTLL